MDTAINVRRADEEYTVDWPSIYERSLKGFEQFMEFVRIENSVGNGKLLAEEETKALEEYWVQHRPKYSPDDLHRWMAISRILKICFKDEFNVNKVFTLENCRLAVS